MGWSKARKRLHTNLLQYTDCDLMSLFVVCSVAHAVLSFVEGGHESNCNCLLILCLFLCEYEFNLCHFSQCVLQDVGSEFSGTVGSSDERGRVDTAYRIIADHVRMMTVAVADGLVPSRREPG